MTDICPHCGVDLRASRIPQEYIDKGFYGAPTQEPRYYYNTIGIEVRGVYDGVLYWKCPSCGGVWHRFPPGDYRHERAKEYVEGVKQS